MCYSRDDPFKLLRRLPVHPITGQPVGTMVFPPDGKVFPSDTLPIAPGLRYCGLGSSQFWHRGGTAIVQTDPDKPVFASADPTSTDLEDYNHGFVLEDLAVFGHPAATVPLLRMQLGGIATVFDRVRFRNTPGLGVELHGVMNQLDWRNVSFLHCAGGALEWHIDGRAHGNFDWVLGQIDNCGLAPIRIIDRSNRPFRIRYAYFRGVKHEFGGQTSPIGVTYSNPGGGEPLVLEMQHCWGQNFRGTGGRLFHSDDPLYLRLVDCDAGAGMASVQSLSRRMILR